MNQQPATFSPANWNYPTGVYAPPASSSSSSSMKYGAGHAHRARNSTSNHDVAITNVINAAAAAASAAANFNFDATDTAAATAAAAAAAPICDASDFNLLSSLASEITEYYQLAWNKFNSISFRWLFLIINIIYLCCTFGSIRLLGFLTFSCHFQPSSTMKFQTWNFGKCRPRFPFPFPFWSEASISLQQWLSPLVDFVTCPPPCNICNSVEKKNTFNQPLHFQWIEYAVELDGSNQSWWDLTESDGGRAGNSHQHGNDVLFMQMRWWDTRRWQRSQPPHPHIKIHPDPTSSDGFHSAGKPHRGPLAATSLTIQRMILGRSGRREEGGEGV